MQAAFRAGIDAGRDRFLQEGFEEGVADAAMLGRIKGALRGYMW